MFEFQCVYLLVFLLLGLLAAFWSYLLFHQYGKFYKYFKKNYEDEWRELMNRDPLIRYSPKWAFEMVRPGGSWDLKKSVFDVNQNYGDEYVTLIKNKICRSLKWFLVFWPIFLLMVLGYVFIPAIGR
jgi:hypothetical protein